MKIAFVDPIISPLYLAEQLKHYGVQSTVVFSLKRLTPDQKKLRFRPEAFDQAIFVENETATAIAQSLKEQGIPYVFYGYEGSVHFTDLIAAVLCPEFANDPATSDDRRDKYKMQVALERQGLPAVKQIYIRNKQLSALNRRALPQFHFPLILKPVNGSSSAGVFQCENRAALTAYLAGAADRGLAEEVLHDYTLQEYLQGEEYVVDSFSLKGEHHIAGIQRYSKTFSAGSPIYRFTETLDCHSREWHISAEFVKKTLAAIGLNNGFGHTEMFITPAGPRLIEVNPRISGAHGFVQILNRAVYGQNQIDVMARILNLAQPKQKPRKAYSYGRLVILQNWQPKTITELNISLLASLPSYQEHLMLKPVGTHLQIPKALTDSVAYILLAHEQREQVLADYQQLMIWEQEACLF